MTLINSIEAKMWMAIKDRLDSWSETAVYYPDRKYNPTATDAFLIIQDISTDGDTRAISLDCGEDITGILNVSVLVPLTWSWAQHKGLSGRVSDYINSSGPLTYSDATVRFYRRARMSGAGARLDESWNRCEVQAPYRSWG